MVQIDKGRQKQSLVPSHVTGTNGRAELSIFRLAWLHFKLQLDLMIVALHLVYSFVKFVASCFYAGQPKSLKNEIILVTGGASGIGRELCLQLAAHPNVTIVSWDVNQIENELLVKELRAAGVTQAYAYKVDVSDRTQVEETAAKVRKEIGDVTMLFNNAGISGQVGNAWQLKPESVEKVLQVNLLAHSWTLQEFLPAMISKGQGHVIQTCSILGFIHGRYGSSYITSKAAVKAYTEVVKEDVRHLPNKPDIKFTLVYPHNTVTPLTTPFKPVAGKYPFMMTYMTPQFVASTILAGVLRNEEHVYIPGFMRFIAMTLPLIPPAVLRRLTDIMDIQFELPSS